MKSNIKKSMLLMISILFLGLSACKKDKTTDNPQPQPVEVKTITITELRALSTTASVKISDGRKFKGIVISDVAAKNIDSKTVVVQEATNKPAVIITFDAAQTFAIGDEIEVTASNQTLAQVNGEIVLQNLPTANAKKTGAGSIAAKETTIAEINTNKAGWNGMLVSVNATDLTSSDGKYKGELTIKDASGTLKSSIVTGATFEANTLPLSVEKVTGIIRLNGSNVILNIRNVNDVTAGDVTRIELLNVNTKLTFNSLTNSGKWNPVLTDAAFLDAQIRYPYMIATNRSSDFPAQHYGLYTTTAFDKTAKYLTITFAGSTMKGDLVRANFTGSTSQEFNLPEFNPSVDKIKIGIVLANSGGNSIESKFFIESPEYTEVGKPFTLRVKLPTEADLKSRGIGATQINDYLSNPSIMIYNLSSKRTTNFSGLVDISPVVISKLEVAY